MPAWLEALKKNATRPLLARLRYLDDLKPRARLTPNAIVALLESGDDDDLLAGDVTRGLVRLVPQKHWLPLARALERHDQGHFPFEMFLAELDFRLLPVASAALEGPDAAFALRLLGGLGEDERLLPAFKTAWPAIERRIDDPDFECAYRATELATRGRRPARLLVRGLKRVLAVAKEARSDHDFLAEPDAEHGERADKDDAFISYDLQVLIENLFWNIAHAGPKLRALSPSLAPFLKSDIAAWRWAALLAAVGIGADALLPEIKARRARSDPDATIEESLAAYACWLFGGTNKDLSRALELSSDNLPTRSRTENALEVSAVSPRLLKALRDMAADPTWTAAACRVLAKIGRPAAKTLRALPALTPDSHDYVWDCEARWRCGLQTSLETRRVLEPALAPACAFEVQAWGLYVELAAEDEAGMKRLRDEASRPAARNPNPCGGSLFGAPHVAARLLPELIRAGHEDLVLVLHRLMPSDAFWSAAEARGR